MLFRSWATDNSNSMELLICLSCGSSLLGTAGVWGGAILGITGQTQFSATGSATFYITGVQLEKGSTATAFDYRPYGTELALCQRYYQTTKASGGYGVLTYSTAATTNQYISATSILPVVMRTSPTLVWFDRGGVSGKVEALTSAASFNGASTNVYGSSTGSLAGIAVQVNLYGTTAYGLRADYTADAEL